MKHLELHIIQSVPVACLNRDDLNSPKTAIFGGVQRARVSSQSWKRAVRDAAKETSPKLFKGERTRMLYEPLASALDKAGVKKADIEEAAKSIIEALVKLDDKKEEQVKSKTMYFMSPLEFENIAKVFAETKEVKKALKGVKSEHLKDAADISIFGRMVASDHTLTVEAAAMFSHALSTHKVDNEIDFFSAVDDLKSDDDAGAGMTGTLEFNSATYYRFTALNLDMLADESHLASMSKEERQEVVRTFVEATVKAVPTARKNSMNGNTLPVYVLGLVREKGHPVQLVNAFEKPVGANQGYVEESIKRLKDEYEKLKNTWGLEAVFEKAIPDVGIKEILDGVVAHVV